MNARFEVPGRVPYREQTSEAPDDNNFAEAEAGADPAKRIACSTPTIMPHDTVVDSYILPRTYLSSSRLNYQFYLWRETLPFPRLLHPCIPLPTLWPSPPQRPDQLASPAPGRPEPHPYPTPPPAASPLAFGSPALHIADVATGTAIWPIQLSRNLPASASLCGFDISLSQAPPRAWLPHNLELREWNIYTPVPEDCLGKFDIVHVRLLLLVLTPATVGVVVRHLAQMLRHGGWLQWEELDLARTCLQRAEGELAATTALPIMESTLEVMQRQGDEGWVAGLEDVVREEGFEDVRVERYWDGVQEARAVFEMVLIKDEELVRKSSMDEATRKAAMSRIEAMYDESRRGAVLSTPKLVCMARKWGAEVGNGRATEAEPLDRKLMNGAPTNQKFLNLKSVDAISINEGPMNGKSMDFKPMDEQPINERSINEKLMDEELVDEKLKYPGRAEMKLVAGEWEEEAEKHVIVRKTDSREIPTGLGLEIAHTKTDRDLLGLEVQRTQDPDPTGPEVRTMSWKAEMKETSRLMWHDVFPC